MKHQVKAEMAKRLKWVQHSPGTSSLRQKKMAKRGPKRSRGQPEVEELPKEWEIELPQMVSEPGEGSSQTPLSEKGTRIIQLLQEGEKGYEARIVELQEKIKEKDVIIATLTQIKEDMRAIEPARQLGL